MRKRNRVLEGREMFNCPQLPTPSLLLVSYAASMRTAKKSLQRSIIIQTHLNAHAMAAQSTPHEYKSEIPPLGISLRGCPAAQQKQ